MAPNRQELGESLHSLNLSLHFQTTTKYPPLIPAPLTTEEATFAVSCDTIVANLLADAQSTHRHNHVATETRGEDEDYWNMPADEDVDYFSAAHVEAMLVKDADRRESANLASSPEARDAATVSVSYWDWSENDVEEEPAYKRPLIDDILMEECICQILSCDNVAAQESRYHSTKKATPTVSSTPCNSMHASHDYYYFPSDEGNEAMIFREEERLQVLFTANIVKNLIRESQGQTVPMNGAVAVDCRTNSEEADECSYWAW